MVTDFRNLFFMNEREFEVGVIRPIDCMKEAFELIKADYWLLFAVSLVGILIGGATMYVLLGAMICGIMFCYLERIDGRQVSFDGLWKGFQWWLPGLIAVLIIAVPMVVVYMILYAPFIVAMVMGSKLNEGELVGLLAGALVIDLVVVVLMVCFHTLLIFVFPLIVDRNYGVWKAITTSMRAVWANLGGVAGLYGVGFVLSLAGMLAFCVGTYFVLPIIMAGNILAYRKVFPARGRNMEPPSPPNFSGAGSYR